MHLVWYHENIKLTRATLGIILDLEGYVSQYILFGPPKKVFKEFGMIQYSLVGDVADLGS